MVDAAEAALVLGHVQRARAVKQRAEYDSGKRPQAVTSSSGIAPPAATNACFSSPINTRPCSTPGTQRRMPSSASIASARWL